MNIKRTIKFWFQRRIRGWDDSVTWNLETGMMRWMLPRLKRFRELTIAYPCCLNSHEEWLEILDKMIYAFEKLVENNLADVDNIEFHPDCKAVQEGYNLFNEYWRALWW